MIERRRQASRRSCAAGLCSVLLLASLALASRPAAADEGSEQRPAPTAADKKAAAKAFAEGKRAFQLGDYRHAAESFEEAFRLAPHHSPLWNAARAWHRAGNLPRAANLYVRYLEEAPPRTPDRNRATTSLEELRAQLGRIEVHAASGVQDVTLDGEPITEGPMFVTPGTHTIEGKSGDKPIRKSQPVGAGETVSVALEPPPPEEKAPPPPPPPVAPPKQGWSPTVAYVGGAVTLAGAAFTTWSGVNTLSQKDTFDTAPTQQNLDEGKSRQTRTNVGLGVTLAAAAFTTVAAVWLVDWESSDTPDSGKVQVGAGYQSITVQGRF